MQPSDVVPPIASGARRLPIFRTQRLTEHTAPAPAVKAQNSAALVGSSELAALSPLETALAMMAALVAPDSLQLQSAPERAEQAPLSSISHTEPHSDRLGVASLVAPLETFATSSPPEALERSAGERTHTTPTQATSPFDPAKGEPVAAPQRMSFAAMDAKLDSAQQPLVGTPAGQLPALAAGPTGVLQNNRSVSTAEKTTQAVGEMRLQQAITAAKKAKGQLDMAKFGLHNEAQWLLFSPHRYDDYSTLTDNFSQLMIGNVALVKGVVQSKKLFNAKKQETTSPRDAVRLLAVLADKYGKTVAVTSFGKPGFAWKAYNEGSVVHLRVKPQRAFSGHGLELANPEIVDKHLLGQIVPIYPPLRVTKGGKFAIEVNRSLGLIEMAAQIVEDDSGWHDRHAPVRMDELTQFNTAMDMLKALHRPTSVRQGEAAMLAAKRLSSYTLVRKTAERAKAIRVNPKSMVNIDLVEIESLKARLPYVLTGDQHSCIDGISRSLRGPKPMDGLLSGDVGTGKTAAFLIPMVAAHKAGKRVMLLTPNLLLIAQVARELKTYFPEVSVCTVNGKGGIQGEHETSIIIGSTALINAMKKGKIGKKPDFLVVDEQHKFSVEQREALRDTHTNKLEATATPIPRTAALALHGAHDLFLLRDAPVVKTIRTEVLGADSGKQAGQAIIDALRRGEQACVIYPLVNAAVTEDGEPAKNANKSVTGAADNWKKFVAMQDIAVLHGKMKDDEKESVLNDFRCGNKKLLLASIVIEVGVTLPELKTMLVTDADRFGVVTLHQLRGRLARHGGEGHFVLYSQNTEDPDVMERLMLVKNNTDGFDLAEKDAEVRGYGDLLGIDGDNQSGATRALFQGVKIGPRDISFAAHLHEKAISLGDSDEHNHAQMVKKGANLRLA